MDKKIPVVVLNGFLGSGKTTLFRNLLTQSSKKNINVCAIVNDMSELDVDGELVGNVDLIEDNKDILISISSCVLSSKKGISELDTALNKMVDKICPELIIIETSGSCHPMPLIEYFEKHNKVNLTGLFTLVDSAMLKYDYNWGNDLFHKMEENLKMGIRDTTNLLIEQIMFCSHLILTKTDKIESSNLETIDKNIKNINPFVNTYSIVFGNLNIDSLLKLNSYDYFKVKKLINELKPVLKIEEKQEINYDIITKIIKDDRPFHPQRLWDVCQNYLDKKIYRSKGFFWLASRDQHSLLWQQAAAGISLELIGTWRSSIIEDPNHGLSEMEILELKELLKNEHGRFGDRKCDLTVIGDKNKVDGFTNKLKSCFLTEDEIVLWKNGHKFSDPWPKNIVNVSN